MKTLYTGPAVNAELLVVMLEKHGIVGHQEWVNPDDPDDGDLNRSARILVPEAEYDRAYQLFFSEREDEF